MVRPVFNPDVLSHQVAPGDTLRVSTTLASAPSAARFAPSLRNGEGFVRVLETQVFQVVTRPYTEEEIRELPPRMREEARRNGRVEERVLFERAEGQSFVAVETGQTVEILLELSVPPQTLEHITAATLVVESPAWETVELPVFCVIGRASYIPVVEPEIVRAALMPGESKSAIVVIPAAPSGDSLIACIVNGRGVIRLTHVIAFTTVRRDYTEEELREMPPWLREELRREGYLEQVERSRSNGTQPLAVAAGEMVHVYLDLTAPPRGFPEVTEASLVIDSPRWQRRQTIARLNIGRMAVELSTESVSISQGGTAEIVVSAQSLAGFGDDVYFRIDSPGDKIHIPSPSPPRLRVEARRGAAARLTLFAEDDAPVGRMPATFEARVFEQLQLHRLPLQIDVIPGGVTVGARPSAITARQGDTVTFEVFAISEGATKNMTFAQGGLPEGVHIEPASFPVGPGRASQVQSVRMFIDRNAPATRNAWTPIVWSANDGIHSGILSVPLTIEMPPEERVFRQEITTPAGTALGGFAEVVIRNDGTYTFRGHMHGSGFDPYSFRVGFFIATPETTLADTFTSRVGGTIGGGPRDRDWDRPGRNELIRERWTMFRNAGCTFNKWYEDTGALGTLEEFLLTATEFLLLRALAGPAAAAVLLLGPELAQLTEMPIARPQGVPGSIILGGVVLLFGPLAAVPTVVAGVAVARIEDVKSRPMHPSEIEEARKVFGDTLPIDRIRVTNLSKGAGPDERNFCELYTIDKTIILGMGHAFDTEMTNNPSFMHELTHAWQWAHEAFTPAKMWGAIERVFMNAHDEADLYRFAGSRPWRDYESEGQATIVETWYQIFRDNLDSEAARSHFLFPYIANHIRMGNP